MALPRSRRTYAFPILIGLAVFALIIVIRIVWGGINMADSTDDAMSAGESASPPAVSAPADQPSAAATGTAESAGSLDRDVQAEPSTGPGSVEPTPGAIDVPGGATTTPSQPATTP